MSLSHAILGFLSYEPMSGYGLKKHFDESIVHFWSATQSHIYRELEGLELQGLATCHTIAQEGRPDRKEYAITEAGREELQAWLTEPLPLAPIREAWLIQLFFGHHLANEELIGLLQARRGQIQQKLDELARARAALERRRQKASPRMARTVATWEATLDYGFAHYRAEAAWLEKMMAQMAQLPE